MIAMAPNFTILVIGRILSSAALIIVKVLALTAMLTIPKNRGKMIGVVYTGFSGANVFGVPIGTMIGDAIGWRFTFLFIIIVSVIGCTDDGVFTINIRINQVQRQWGSTSNKQLIHLKF